MRQPHGQNFLTDKHMAAKIVSSAALSPGDTAFEIGPGKGILTGLIAQTAKKLKAIEIDPGLSDLLYQKFSGYDNTEIIYGDFLKYDFAAEPGPLKIISNMPYNVATAMIEKFLPEQNWSEAVVMVQEEAAKRILATVSTGNYGYFTIFCRHYASAERLFSVAPECFSPKPEIDSAVIRLTNKFSPRLEPALISLIKSAFLHRRKTAINSISTSLDIPKKTVTEAFELSRIGLLSRPENLDIAQYILLLKNLPLIV